MRVHVQQRVTQALRPVQARAVRLAGLALAALLAGCSSFTLEPPLLITDPGKYLYHNCDQINTMAKAMANRLQDLKTLIAKADQGFAGPFVSTVAYRADYLSVTEELRLLEETARNKKCVTPSTWQSNSVIQ